MINLRDLEAHWGGLVVSTEGHVIQFPGETFQLPSEVKQHGSKNGDKSEAESEVKKSAEEKERQPRARGQSCARGDAREQSTAGVMLTRSPMEYPNLLLEGKSWRRRETEWWFDDVEPGNLPGKKRGCGTGEVDLKNSESAERNGNGDDKTEGDESERKGRRPEEEAERNGPGLGAEAEGNATERREADGRAEGEDEKEKNRGAEHAEKKDLDSGNGNVVGGWDESSVDEWEKKESGSEKEDPKTDLGAPRQKDGEFAVNGENSDQRAETQRGKGLDSSLPSDETEDRNLPEKRREEERKERFSGISVGCHGEGRSVSGSSFAQDQERSGISEELLGNSERRKGSASDDDRFGLLQKIRGTRAMAKKLNESDEVGGVAAEKSNPGGSLKRTDSSWGSKKLRRKEMPQAPLGKSPKGIERMKHAAEEMEFLAEAEGDGGKERSTPEEDTVAQERTERQSGRKGSKERSLKVSEGKETDVLRLRGGTGDESGLLGDEKMREEKLAAVEARVDNLIESCQEKENDRSEAELQETDPPVSENTGPVGGKDSAAEKPSEAAYSAGSRPPEAPAGSKPPGDQGDSARKSTSHKPPTSSGEPSQDDLMEFKHSDGGTYNESGDLSEDEIPGWGGAQPGDNVGAAAAQSLAEPLAQGVLDAVHPRGGEEVDLVKRVGVSMLIIEDRETVN
jgi:hypothetical protein